MILVTGGLGYIGSHTVASLLEQGYEVLVIDDFSNSSIDVLEGIHNACGKRPVFEKLNLLDINGIKSIFEKYSIKGIIHFAAFKAVGESVEKPIKYYNNNLVSLLNLIGKIKEEPVPFIFSSSCTVYGEVDILPISENSPIKPAISPYGNTKQIGEEILVDTANVTENLEVILLRYFNPIGAHHSNAIGELPIGKPQNLVPFITQTAAGIYPKLTVFGDDYPTEDGTNIRDYIHVVDLAEAHIVALERMLYKNLKQSYEIYNLGTGKGSSVLEVINSFERVSGVKLAYEIGKRREGDVVAAYADTSKAEKELNWKTKRTLDQAISSAWEWEKKIRNLQ